MIKVNPIMCPACGIEFRDEEMYGGFALSRRACRCPKCHSLLSLEMEVTITATEEERK